MKKLSLLLLVGLLLTTALVSCGDKEKPTEEVKTPTGNDMEVSIDDLFKQ